MYITKDILVLITMIVVLLLTAFCVLVYIQNKQREAEYTQNLSKLLGNAHSQNKENLFQWITLLQLEKTAFIKEYEGLRYDKKKEKIKTYYQNKLFVDNIDKLEELINSKLDNYAYEFRRSYTELSDREYTLLYLILLDIPDDDISNIMDYSYASMPTTKHRLSKKLGLPSPVEIRPFLISLLS